MAGNDELEQLIRYFEEGIHFSSHIRSETLEVEAGRTLLGLQVDDIHMNGNGTLHGGVYASLIDNAMGIAVSALVGVRTATTQMNVHFLGAVSEGRITCRGEVIHRTRRTATAEARVYDGQENLLAMGTGAFRIFEQQGHPIV